MIRGFLMAFAVVGGLLTRVALASPLIGMDASFNVSLSSGAAGYSVPISVPPGVAGMIPSLAFSYNSQSGNGLMGIGWSLSGLSSITRCGQTIATNGVRGTVNYDSNDRFCYNGQQLVAVTGAYGADGTVYTTETEQYSKIISHGGTTISPGWWEVKTRGGQDLQFGNSANSIVVAAPSANTESWWANQMADAAGNVISVTYISTQGSDPNSAAIYPSTITYGGNPAAGTTATAEVQFVWTTRSDNRVQYASGVKHQASEILSAVKSFVGSGGSFTTPVAEYDLAYAISPDSQRSRLTSITRFDDSGQKAQANQLPALTFGWSVNADGLAPDLLTSISNGLGATSSIAYYPLTQASVYGKGSGAAYPSVDYIGSTYVVAAVAVDSGTTNSSGAAVYRNSVYYYTQARMDLNGRGFLGFSSGAAVDETNNTTEYDSFSQAFPTIGQQLYVASSATNSAGANVTIKFLNNTLSAVCSPQGVFYPYVKSQAITRSDLNGSAMPSATTSTTLDSTGPATTPDGAATPIVSGCTASTTSWGNVALVTNSTSDGYAKTTTNTFYSADTVNWILNRLQQSVVSATSPDQPTPVVRTSSFTYYGAGASGGADGLLQQETIEPSADSGQDVLQSAYVYDSFGNIKSKTVSGYGIASRTDTGVYDNATGTTATGQFPTQVTNALSQSATRTFNPVCGTLATSTDPNGVTVSATYDAFCRIKTQTAPDGTVKSFTYDYCGFLGDTTQCPSANEVFQVKVTVMAADGVTQVAPTSLSYYDKLGRVVGADTQAFNGSTSRVSTAYTVNGQVFTTTNPYTVGAAQITTEFKYDSLERLTETDYPDGSTELMTYNGQTVQKTGRINLNGVVQTQSLFTDGNDNVKWSEDTAGNKMSFTYDGLNERLSATDSAGNVSNWVYARRGWPNSVTRPDNGTVTLVHDVLGEVTGATDANGNHSTMAYDVLGRMKQRVEPDMTSNWTYDQAGAIGLPYQATATGAATVSGGYIRTQSYDALERLTKTVIQLGGTSYTVSQGYDPQGRPNSFTSASGDVIGTTYNALGYLNSRTRVTGTGVLALWTVTARDPDGALTGSNFGAYLTQAHTYDPDTRRVTAISTQAAVPPSPSFTLQNLTYSYDPAGNVKERHDIQNGVDETYNVDQLNRLSSVSLYNQQTGTFQQTRSFAYDALGDITNKSDVGNYNYPAAGQPQPHGVTSIVSGIFGTLPYAYDKNGNMTTNNQFGVTYYSFNKTKSFNAYGVVAQGFTYDPEHNKLTQTSNAYPGPVVTTTTFLPGADLVTTASGSVWHSYVMAEGASAGELQRTAVSGGSTTVVPLYYFLDGQNSVSVVTNGVGQAPSVSGGGSAELDAYDAWGQRRNVNGSAAGFTNIISVSQHGYLNQNQNWSNAFIDLNARYYSSDIGRFMGVDPMVGADPADLQDWDGYSYAGNNPMAFSDPSGMCRGFFDCLLDVVTFNLPVIIRHNSWAGEFFEIAAAVACAPAGPVASAGCTAGASSFVAAVDGQPIERVLESGALTFAEAVAFNEVGNLTGHGLLSLGSANFYENVAGHALVGGTFSVIQGGKFGSGALAAGFSAAVLPVLNVVGLYDAHDPVLGLAESAAVGGAASTLGGGKFGNGALTGAFGYLFNEAACVSQPNGCQLDFSAPHLTGVAAVGVAALGIVGGGVYYLGYEAVALAADVGADGVAAEGIAGGAQSALAGPALAGQLSFEPASSAFAADGTLSDGALSGAREIIPSSEIGNPAVPDGFSKFSTQPFQSPSGDFQVHFYMNPETSEPFYGLDYKSIFNSGRVGP